MNWNFGKNLSGFLGEYVKLNKYIGEFEILIDLKIVDKEILLEEFENVNKYIGELIFILEINEYIVEVKINCKNYKLIDKKFLKFRRLKLNILKFV